MRGAKQANEISSGDLGDEQEASQHGCGQAGQVPQEPVMMTGSKEEPRDPEKLNPMTSLTPLDPAKPEATISVM